jgi:hypothetical protein
MKIRKKTKKKETPKQPAQSRLYRDIICSGEIPEEAFSTEDCCSSNPHSSMTGFFKPNRLWFRLSL